MMDVRTVAERAAKWRAKEELRHALRILETKCTVPRQARAGASDLVRAILGMTLWPSLDDLLRLDSSVRTLSLSYRKKVPEPLWKAYELVNQRCPGFGLIRRLNALVLRVRKLLNEAGESELATVRREASGSGEHASEAKKFLADIRTLQEDPKTATKIDWQHYERFLRRPEFNKRVRLSCGDFPASPRVMCYAHALEMIVHDEYRKRLLDKAEPLLIWIVFLGNPAYSVVLRSGDFMEWAAARKAQDAAVERAERKHTKARQRQKRFRERRIFR